MICKIILLILTFMPDIINLEVVAVERKIDIGKNIKHFRETHKMTQRQLAEHIGYTEKSVSKWENNDGLPTLDVLTRLCNLFQISLDELIYQKISKLYLLGIDGGGTKTVFRLTDTSGKVIRTVSKSSSNPNDIGMDNAKKILDQGIWEVCQGIPYRNIAMFAGLSGGGLTGDNRQLLNEFFAEYGFWVYENGSDVENLIALAKYPQCILMIMGTGCIGYCLNGKERQRVGGWGYHFEEGGSGYCIGRDAISAVLSASDGSGEKTILAELLEDRTGETADRHLTRFYTEGKQYIASFADLVFTAAANGDPVAENILDGNMHCVAGMLDAAQKHYTTHVPVLFFGGISSHYEVLFPMIRKYLNQPNMSLEYISDEQVDGALLRAKQLLLKNEGGSIC